jgi:hypothetical protein
MTLFAIFATVKDWADLIHALAWPGVVVFALLKFRKNIDDVIRDILTRIPWERTTGFKAGRVGEFKMSKKVEETIVKQTTIPPGKPPLLDDADEGRGPDGE